MIARLSPDPPQAAATSWPARERPHFAAYKEILSDGRTVWINDFDGMCIGRFSKTGSGSDKHKPVIDGPRRATLEDTL